MRFVGLTKEEMRNIRRMLRQADGIGITTHADYTELRYRRVGFGLYLYRFYNRPIPADEWDKMDCSLIPYNDTVVFEYAGGAIGGICFPGREEYLVVRRKN